MTIVIRDPLAEPLIHRDMPGGLEDLQEYVMEVLDGIKDHCIRNTAEDPEDTRWEYTYHQRLFAYSTPRLDELGLSPHLIARMRGRWRYLRKTGIGSCQDNSPTGGLRWLAPPPALYTSGPKRTVSAI